MVTTTWRVPSWAGEAARAAFVRDERSARRWKLLEPREKNRTEPNGAEHALQDPQNQQRNHKLLSVRLPPPPPPPAGRAAVGKDAPAETRSVCGCLRGYAAQLWLCRCCLHRRSDVWVSGTFIGKRAGRSWGSRDKQKLQNKTFKWNKTLKARWEPVRWIVQGRNWNVSKGSEVKTQRAESEPADPELCGNVYPAGRWAETSRNVNNPGWKRRSRSRWDSCRPRPLQQSVFWSSQLQLGPADRTSRTVCPCCCSASSTVPPSAERKLIRVINFSAK